jgi:tetratricopeptide (TPR) repeat protein
MFRERKLPPILRKALAGEQALAKGHYGKVVTLLTEVIEDPAASQLEREVLSASYLNRGFALRKLDRQEEALADYARASQLNPATFKPHLNAGLIYGEDHGRYHKALEEFDKTIELNPTCTEALSSRGLTKMLLNDLEGAEADLQTALSLEPNHVDALCNLGNVYAARGDFEHSAELYRRALETAPKDAQIRFNLALALMRMGAERAGWNVLKEDKNAMRLWESRGGNTPPSRSGCCVVLVVVVLCIIAVGLPFSIVAFP